jgi:predicted ferric reductase
MPESLPPRRLWIGYSVIALSVVLSLLLWVVEMARAGELYASPWVYLAKLGSHGTLTLMCWAFLLATRFRAIELLFGGLDKVYRAHRVVGETAFFLIFLHPIFLAVHFSESIRGFFRYLWFSGDWVRNTGIIALAFFALLVVLSIYVKIAYHRWKRTHDFFGLLLVLIVIHAAISGGEIMRYPVLTLWHGIWVGLGLSAYAYIRLFYRFAGPQYDFVTTQVKEIGDSISEVYLRPLGRSLHYQPGQFVYISFDSDAVSEEPHPFSISSGPEEPELRLSIKQLGDWTQNVAAIQKGELARVWGPYGHFSDALLKNPDLPAVFLAGGIGVTPFLSLLRSKALKDRPGKILMIYSVPRPASQAYRKELDELAQALPQLAVIHHLSEKEGFIDRAYLEDHLEQALDRYLFLICGPGPMMNAFGKLLPEAGLKQKQIVMEEFAIR